MSASVVFCSIVLNESQFIRVNLLNHIEQCDKWIIVEGADRRYPADRVTAGGLSTDGTADLIREVASRHPGKVELIQHGWADSKEQLRNVYAKAMPAAARCVVVFDADEFLTPQDLSTSIAKVSRWREPGVLRLPHVHYWKTPQQIIVGGYYSVAHNRIYRWQKGAVYQRNHNHPELPNGKYLHEVRIETHDLDLQYSRVENRKRAFHPRPAFYHYGFCKSPEHMQDKNNFYIARGEAVTRAQTTANRAAWFSEGTPAGCQLIDWCGENPVEAIECEH